ncbi:uncharacterized protein LOC124936700 [Impatiens glandulifera]|uniref:uncharacterized protein LOC124936700 n=1 Tax=Impatiens glandulifera TaxID=253017 RepID=UPI001FB0E051|nr:uncharacterized protein LOC124936700 [Impatiens glandulifera]
MQVPSQNILPLTSSFLPYLPFPISLSISFSIISTNQYPIKVLQIIQIKMGFLKETTKSRQTILRVLKTLFFLINMFISLLLCAAPILLIIIDSILPSILLLSTSFSPQNPLSLQTISTHFTKYNFTSSLIDIPIISLIRSAFILCVYSLCDGPSLSRGPYLGITMICSVSSLVFVSLKASFVFNEQRIVIVDGRKDYDLCYVRAVEMALFVCSWVLAVGHMVVAYRTSCRERRKLLIYKIDIEAVSAYKKGFLRYQKMILEEKMRKDDNNKLGKL